MLVITLGSSRRIENLLDLDQVASSYQMLGEIYLERIGAINVEPSLQNQILMENSFLSGSLKRVDVHVDHCVTGSPTFRGRNITSEGRDSVGVGISGDSALVLEQHDFEKIELVEVASVLQSAGVGQSFHDAHCKTMGHDRSEVLTEVVTDDVDSSSSHQEREQPEEDGENDEMLAGIFAFSEEGKYIKL